MTAEHRTARNRVQSANCRAARSSRCDRTWDCSASRPMAAMVPNPQPEKKTARRSASADLPRPAGVPRCRSRAHARHWRSGPASGTSRHRGPHHKSRDLRHQNASSSKGSGKVPPAPRAVGERHRPRRRHTGARSVWPRRDVSPALRRAMGPFASRRRRHGIARRAVLPALFESRSSVGARAIFQKPSPSGRLDRPSIREPVGSTARLFAATRRRQPLDADARPRRRTAASHRPCFHNIGRMVSSFNAAISPPRISCRDFPGTRGRLHRHSLKVARNAAARAFGASLRRARASAKQ